ncbi:MAG: peptidoglycan DD-metalloendopeptidase family protein [Anaerolineales bacterium]
MNKFSRSILPLLALLLIICSPVSAQENTTAGPTYEIQAGDTLWTIALNLHVSYDEMLAANGLTANSSIIPGTILEIPGLDGISGTLGTVDVPYGESLQSISRRYGVPEEEMIRLNRLTSPLELYVGVSAVVVGEDGISEQAGERKSLAPGQSALELAVQTGLNPWVLINANGEQGSWDMIPGEVLLLPGTESDGPGGFPAAITRASFTPKRFVQGHTNVIQIAAPEGTQLSGSLGDYPLSFFTKNGETYFALQGLHARENTGLKQLSISGSLPDGTPIAHTQMVEIFSGNYPYEDVVGVPQNTVGVDVTEEEEQALEKFTRKATETKYWSGIFASPVPAELSGAYASYFGGRRSYNGSGYYYFHTGLDYYGVMGQDIYAAAPGKVVFTGPLLLHGNTTLIDHGWGVFTLYAHQSEFLVQEGQQVSAGELIGRVGNTGRSIGPHLHFEVWVGGLQVDPLDWLENSYP